MPLDIKTLLACNTAIAFFMAAALLFYKINYKTYPGYGFFLCSIVVLAIAYVSMILREFMPLWLGIVLTNLIFIFSGVIRIDGVRRFVCNQKLNKIYYLIPFGIIPILLFLFFVKNDIILRNLFLSIFLTLFSIMISLEFYRNRTKENRNLYLATALFYLLYGLLVFTRAILWFINPQDSLFFAGMSHQIYFLVVTVFEVGVGLTWLMMNNQRLETELMTSKDNLQATVCKLEKAMSEVKMLSGIIPICMHCKGIRDDQGFWNRIEQFISEHSEAEFSHGICPKCMKEKYPEFTDDMDLS
jgi:hypothetical protein